MSNRQDKKYRRIMKREAKKEIEGMFAAFEEHLRPKPRWIPETVWRWGQRIFIKMDAIN